MASYVTLINFTERGELHIKDTCKRAESFKAKAKSMGVAVKEILWTMGTYDGVVIYDAPDDETATAAMLGVAALGNVKTQTLRAFGAGEMEKILGKAFK